MIVGRGLAPAAHEIQRISCHPERPTGAEGSVSLFFWITNPSTPLRMTELEVSMKRLSIPTWLQIIYCICCMIVVLVMILYTVCYDTAFGDTLFKIGGIINFLCALSPIGIVSGVWNLCRYTSKKKCGEVNRKLLAWVIVGPVLTTLLWVSSICAFVYYSGGV